MQIEPDMWFMSRAKFGELNTVLIAPRSQAPVVLVVLCHGFGASGADLVGVAEELLHYLPTGKALPAFLIPEAPIDMADEGMYGSRAWWRLNMAKLMELCETNSIDSIKDEVPVGIVEARISLCKSVLACIASYKWQGIRLVVGGFSQGAMLSVETVVRGSLPNVCGLVVWSGALICESAWRAAFKEHDRRISVFQSHGSLDPILPVQTGRMLNKLLNDLMPPVNLLEFAGPHTIPTEAIEGASHMIGEFCKAQSSTFDAND
jgi:phospholipase/carboxylesterase